jgi:hypothetical protein
VYSTVHRHRHSHRLCECLWRHTGRGAPKPHPRLRKSKIYRCAPPRVVQAARRRPSPRLGRRVADHPPYPPMPPYHFPMYMLKVLPQGVRAESFRPPLTLYIPWWGCPRKSGDVLTMIKNDNKRAEEGRKGARALGRRTAWGDQPGRACAQSPCPIGRVLTRLGKCVGRRCWLQLRRILRTVGSRLR